MIRISLCLFVLGIITTEGCDQHTTELGSSPNEEVKINWPDLSEFTAIVGRPAVEDDIKAGHATFVLQADGESVGQPLEIELPQYINHIDVETGEKTPGILIQAEEVDSRKIVGFIAWPSREPSVATIQEIELLGIKKPK